MATYKLNKATTSTWEINESGSIWILGDKGRITGTDIDGIATVGFIDEATVRINGEIDVEGAASRGVYLTTKIGAITVSENGRVSAEDTALEFSNFDGFVTIDNAGVLTGEYGIASGSEQGLTEITTKITNSGRITATLIGIGEVGAGALITNSGTIKADFGISVTAGSTDDNPTMAEHATHIVNTGKITGADSAIDVYDANPVAVNIRNRGTLNGDILLGFGEDVLDTRGGTINGTVFLGGGNDMLDARKATINGAIFGGLGDDFVTLASAAQVFVEDAAEGSDTVRINASYLLGENIENLTLLGKANHTGIGNVHANILTGNKGANVLYGQQGGDTLDGGKGNDLLSGGADNDVFVFKAGNGKDTIMDFDDGADHIDLTAYGFASFDDDVAPLIATTAGGDIVITLSDTDKLVIRDGESNNVALDVNDFYL